MNEKASKRLVSGRSMKVVAGGVSLVALALLAVLTAGLLANDPTPESSRRPASAGAASTSPRPGAAIRRPGAARGHRQE